MFHVHYDCSSGSRGDFTRTPGHHDRLVELSTTELSPGPTSRFVQAIHIVCTDGSGVPTASDRPGHTNSTSLPTGAAVAPHPSPALGYNSAGNCGLFCGQPRFSVDKSPQVLGCPPPEQPIHRSLPVIIHMVGQRPASPNDTCPHNPQPLLRLLLISLFQRTKRRKRGDGQVDDRSTAGPGSAMTTNPRPGCDGHQQRSTVELPRETPVAVGVSAVTGTTSVGAARTTQTKLRRLRRPNPRTAGPKGRA